MNFSAQCYLSDPYRVSFSSRVAEAEPVGNGLFAVYLDETYFYPDSGGQPDDRGTLDGKTVVGVAESEKGVRHLVQGELCAGAEVEGRIDWARRFDHMQQHSGQHLLSRVFLEDDKLKTVSFHLGEEICTIDLEGGTPSEETLEAAEAKANNFVYRNIPISCRVVGADEFAAIPPPGSGTPVPRSRLPEGIDRVRLVEIEGFDSSTCCGTHVRSTGEIGIIKILGAEKIKGNARVEFICGGRAAKDYAAKHTLLGAIASGFTTDWREVPRIVEKLTEENRELRKKSEELGHEIAGFRAAELSKPTASAGGFDIVQRSFASGDAVSLRETATKIREMGKKIILFGLSGPSPALIFACSAEVPLNMGEIMRACAAVIGARGGGGKDFAQGGGGDGSRITEALDAAERMIRETLGA
jgi:alanyl-tRNA synthetase